MHFPVTIRIELFYFSKVKFMRMIVMKNISKNTVLASDLRIANTFWSRLKGLLGTNYLPEGKGLLITPCNSIHMFGMRYAIDVVFLDSAWRVLKVLHQFPPGKTAACPGSAQVLELPVGTLIQTRTTVGDQLLPE